MLTWKATDILVVFLIVLSGAVAARYRWSSRRNRGRPYPPGPPAYPVVGNIVKIPPKGPWLKFAEYKKRYGDLVYFQGLGNSILVLNSAKVINDLLDKRADVYSHRPELVVAGELMRLDQGVGSLPYGREWRTQRKLCAVALSATAVKQYYGVQEDAAALLAKALVTSPESFTGHVRLAAARIVLTVTYGIPVKSFDDELVKLAEDTMDVVTEALVPGTFLVDFLPFLKILPSWMPFHQYGRRGKALLDELMNSPFERVKRNMDLGEAPPSLTQHLLGTKFEGMSNIEHSMKWATGTMYGAGGETTYAVVMIFILAMALYPEKQWKAQEEIDALLGGNRLPIVADRDHLPYVSALIKETMRWYPVVPLSLPRMTAEDDVYEGYFVPKGTIVMPNVWSVAFENNAKYPPEQFIPERFLDEQVSTPDPASWLFGFGRRICPGIFLAENSVFVLIATILTAFDISPPPDGELKPEFILNLISYPKPYDCQILPRSDAAVRLVEARALQCNL
ncbi:cytochrome P450 [Heliocybe sulcata]|uniref:Cytochrome P450 n=1 Tax=Heliocybe sulcata TaxID=5364 RepID=A0A5C3MW98_9AGAM|nr:cytochrome P450 [Heliocybe sulcata]